MHKRQLRPPVSVPERVNGVQLCEKSGGRGQKISVTCSSAEGRALQAEKKAIHLGLYIFWVAEPVCPFSDADRAVLPSPSVHILKEMPVNVSIMARRKAAGRERFFRSQRGHLDLESFKELGIGKPNAVFQAMRAWIAIWIVKSFIIGERHGRFLAPV
jgi:hypothetical protein